LQKRINNGRTQHSRMVGRDYKFLTLVTWVKK